MRIAANSQPVKKIHIESMLQKGGEISMENKMRRIDNVICLHLELVDSEVEGTDDPIVKYGKLHEG